MEMRKEERVQKNKKERTCEENEKFRIKLFWVPANIFLWSILSSPKTKLWKVKYRRKKRITELLLLSGERKKTKCLGKNRVYSTCAITKNILFIELITKDE